MDKKRLQKFTYSWRGEPCTKEEYLQHLQEAK